MNKYIDIHSHSGSPSAMTIVNCFPAEIEAALKNQPQQTFSVGLHPWYINSDFKKELETVTLFANHTQVLAIGEAGLDKVCEIPFELQQKIFIHQAKLAESIQKPLIIHCVKAYSELIHLKKELHPTIPWVLHGYRGNKEITQQLLPYNFYFSFGKGISLLQESIKLIPLDRIFLETDDEEINIEEVYASVNNLLHFPDCLLRNQIKKNFESLFIKSKSK